MTEESEKLPAPTEDGAPLRKKKTRASGVTRIFGHLMDVGGGFEAGT